MTWEGGLKLGTKINRQGKDSSRYREKEEEGNSLVSCIKEHIVDEIVERSRVFVSVSLYCGRLCGQRFLSGRQTNNNNKTQTDVALVL